MTDEGNNGTGGVGASGGLVEFRDYIFLNGRHFTLSMYEEYAEGIRDEIAEADEDIRALAFSEEKLKEEGFELTNFMGLIGAKLARAYAILRDAKRRRDQLDQRLDDLINTELSGSAPVPGKNNAERDAYFATKYAMLYRSKRYLNDFIESELQEYVNQLGTMDKVLSRQTSALELEFKITHG